MSVCLRTVSSKLIPLNAIVTSRQPASKLEKKIPSRSQFLEEFLGTRHLSSGNPHYSVPCITPRSDYNNVETPLNVKLESWRDVLQKRCQTDTALTKIQHSKRNDLGEVCNNDDVYGNGDNTSDALVRDSNVIVWHKYPEYRLMGTNQYMEQNARLQNATNNQNSLQHTIYTCERLPMIHSRDVSSSSSISGDGKCYYSSPSEEGSGSDRQGKASQEQLQHVYNVLSDSIPNIFVKVMDYKVYDPQLKFTNNIRGGITTVGLYHYVKQVALLRTVGHIRFAYVKMNILNMAIRPEDSTIIIRWRIAGVSGLRVMLMFWKYKFWKVRDTVNDAETWYDGISTFYVGSNGLIKEHIADKMMPDDNNALDEIEKTPIAAKLALLLGLVPRPTMEDIGPVLEALTNMKKSTTGLSDVDLPVDKIKL